MTDIAVGESRRQPSGVTAFIVVWIGQIVSIIATQMTQFALTVWVYQTTGSVMALGLMQVFFITPFLLISPIAGAMIDRYNRKLMMMMSDLGAGAATIMILVLHTAGLLQVWQLYLASAIMGLFNAFQWPAYSASISLMVPKEQLGRVNGLMSLMEAGPGVVAPLLAGALLPFIQLTGILTIDVATFIIAVVALAIVFVPQPPKTEAGKRAQGSIWKESLFGFRYIFERPSLLGLQLVFFFGNLFAGIAFTVLPAMLLSRGNTLSLASVLSVGAIGAVVGGIVLTVWGGFKRRVHGVLLGHVLSGLLWGVLMGLGQSLPAWATASFLGSFLIPTINGSNQAIWQSKVAPDIQGRVFSARRLIAWLTNPITPIIAGVLADNWLEPAMRSGGDSALAQSFGPLVGTGTGAGIALIILLCGLATAVVGAAGYLFRPIRDAEDILPDYGGAQTVDAGVPDAQVLGAQTAGAHAAVES